MADLDRAALDRYITNAPEPNVFRCANCGESSEDHEQFDFKDQGGGLTWVCPEYTRLARVACKLADKLDSISSDLEDHVLEEPDEDAGHVCRKHCPC